MEIAIYLILGILVGVVITLIITNSKKLKSVQSEKDAVQQNYNYLAKEFEAYKTTLPTELKSTKQEILDSQNEKKYTKESKQLEHKNAYEKWTNEDDEKLEVLYCEGKTVSELSELFKRNQGAILARIKKLELKEKYN